MLLSFTLRLSIHAAQIKFSCIVCAYIKQFTCRSAEGGTRMAVCPNYLLYLSVVAVSPAAGSGPLGNGLGHGLCLCFESRLLISDLIILILQKLSERSNAKTVANRVLPAMLPFPTPQSHPEKHHHPQPQLCKCIHTHTVVRRYYPALISQRAARTTRCISYTLVVRHVMRQYVRLGGGKATDITFNDGGII